MDTNIDHECERNIVALKYTSVKPKALKGKRPSSICTNLGTDTQMYKYMYQSCTTFIYTIFTPTKQYNLCMTKINHNALLLLFLCTDVYFTGSHLVAVLLVSVIFVRC